MLRLMRTGAQSYVIKFILFGFLLLATVGLAMMDYQGMFRNGFKPTTVAEVAGEKISSTEFDQLLQNAMRRQKMKPAEAYRTGYPATFLQNEINSRLLRDVVRDYGLIVSEEAAAKQIRGILESFPTKGVSEKEALQNLLYTMGVDERTLIESQKVDIGLNLLMKSLTAGIKAPEQMAEDALKYQAESRRGEYFTINGEDAGKSEKPSDDELKEFYKKISSRFMLPELRTLSVLVIDSKALVKTSDPTDAELKAHYEEHKDSFSLPETRSVSQIVFNGTEEEARALAAEARAGDFKKTAESHKGKATFVKASDYAEKDLPDEIADAFKSAEGTVMDPVKSPLGYIVAKVEKVIPAHARSYDEVKDQVKKDLEAERSNDNADALYKRANEIDDMAAGGKNLAEIAQSLNLTATQISKIDAAGNDEHGKKADAGKIPQFDKVLAAGFRLQKDVVSERIEAPTGEFVLVEPTEIKESAEQPFDKVKDDVLKAWNAEKHSAAIDQLSAKILDRLKLGESFDSVASSLGKKVTRTDMILRSDHAKAAAMSKGMFPALFALEKVGQVTVVGGGDAESATILRLADRAIDEKHVAKPEDVKQIQAMLDHAVQKDLLEEFRMSLMAKYDVKIHDNVLKDMYKDKGQDDDQGSN